MICSSPGKVDFNTLEAICARSKMTEIRLDIQDLSLLQIKNLFSAGHQLIATMRFGDTIEPKKIEMLELAIDSGATWTDIELSAPEMIVKRIEKKVRMNTSILMLSYHNYSRTPAFTELQEIVNSGFTKGADVVKIACFADSYVDVARLIKLFDDPRPVLIIAMGEKGKVSRILAPLLGAPFTYCCVEGTDQTAPGQLNELEMIEGIRAFSSGLTKSFFVAGSPVLHSQSPILFSNFIRQQSRLDQYVSANCRTAAEVKILLDNGFEGGNITSPLKEKVQELGGVVSPEVDTVCATNTIVNSPKGLFQDNSDIWGVRNSVQQNCQDIKNTNVVVLGTGGAARAAAFAMKQAGANVVMAGRNKEDLVKWSVKLDCEWMLIKDVLDTLQSAKIIINTIPSEASMGLQSGIASHHVVLDADYARKPFESASLKVGATYIYGTEWLIHQAVKPFEQFTGFTPDVRFLRESLRSQQKSYNRIVLIGMMKSGKSTVGKLLAEKIGFQFVDTDESIVKQSGKSISDIFINEGESAFRNLEKDVINTLLSTDKIVIATGGGAILSSSIREKIHENSLCVWLFASPKTLAERSDSDNIRPLLAFKNALPAIEKIHKKRFSFYVEASHLAIVTDVNSPEQLAQIIHEEYNNTISN